MMQITWSIQTIMPEKTEIAQKRENVPKSRSRKQKKEDTR